MTFEEARAQFPVLERLAYLNAGTNGPLARSTTAAIVDAVERDAHDGRSGSAWFEHVIALRDEARRGLAAVIGVESELLALTDSTSRGCTIAISGLGLTPEDEIVITDQEHFGLLGPVHVSGARVVVTAADEDAILAAVTPRTRLIATSHVLWTTGRRLDLARLQEAGLPLLVDGAQSSGAIEVDASGFDFYTISPQKWLCGPDQTGGLYVRDPERLRVATPSFFAAASYEPTGEFVPKPGAARFDSGWTSAPALSGLVAALATHPEWRYTRSAEMAARCRDLLEGIVDVVTPPGHSTLVSFRPPGDPTELVAHLHERGVVVRELPGRNLVRAAVGWWTNEADLQRLVAAIAA
ncbi:MAG: aminotransferase class V-fold PLP-dependent enzyme [Actinobacteria bacterium]|nr:aminotransferase class V-fold PLP-dependent enzyme [Actinomycetota bacterium]